MEPSLPFDPSAHPHPEQLNGSSGHLDEPTRPTAERDAKGRFVKGNPGGPGNPFARQVARLRSALVNRVTEADMERIAEDLLVKARLGDLAAIKLLFLYVLGKPAQAVNPDTLDIEEWVQTIRPIPQIQREWPKALMTVPVDTLSGMVRVVQPFMEDTVADMLARANAAKEQESAKPENQKSERPDGGRAEPAPCEPPSPSANGGNGHTKTDGGPSANGGNGRPTALPPWLAEIAARMPPISGHLGNGKRRGRGKR